MKRLPRARTLAITTAIALGIGTFFAAGPAFADSAPPDPTNPATPPTVTSDVLPTPQIDGVVWSQAVVGNVDYVAGKFTTARPAGSAAGSNTVARNNVLAYDVTTGQLLTSFAPQLNAQALAVAGSPDGTKMYVAGDFTTADGVGAYRIAAYSTATGQRIASFKPVMGSSVRALAVTNNAVYAGGWFTTANGVAKQRVAALDPTTGATLPFQADADYNVNALAAATDGSKVYVGGQFASLSGMAALGLGAVDASSGSYIPWAANQVVQDYGKNASITALAATPNAVYGSGYDWVGGTGNLEGSFSADPASGNIQWIEDCHGDTYSVFPVNSLLYVVGHPHYCGNIAGGGFPQTSPKWTFHHLLAFSAAAVGTLAHDPMGYFDWGGKPSPALQDYFPNFTTGSFTGQNQATWSVAGNTNYVVAGGEFPSVNGVASQGLTRFAVRALAPNKVGPQGIPLVPNAVSFASGQVRVSWNATVDQDNGYLTYKVYRDAGTAPVYTATQRSNFYTTPPMGFVDTGLTPGSTHIYHVKVSDPTGNTVSRDTPSVTVSSSNSSSSYSGSVTGAGASAYWPMDETSGATAYDHVGFSDLTLPSGVTRTTNGPISGSGAAVFDGNSWVTAGQQIAGPDTFTVQAWINTTTTSGGKILGFGNSNTGASGSYDRHVYMDNSGHIWFGVYPGGVATVNSANAYNDGNWHQVTASMSSSGMQLYVDGKLVGSRTDVTSGQQYSGYWRIGGDNLNGWPSQPSSQNFAGSIAQVAFYPTALSRTTIASQIVAAGQPSPIPPAPSDAYGAAVYAGNPEFYWRLGETLGSTAADAGPNGVTGNYIGTYTQQQAGALAGVSDTAVAFNGGAVVSGTQDSNPTVYTEEAWFKTTTTSGGKIIGFGDATNGTSSNYDRHVYMQDNGQVVFGVWTGQTNTITTGPSYNDGKWHQVVATQGPGGMSLYIDGQLSGTNPQTQAQGYNGYWRVGGDTTWGSSSPWFNGTIDEAAVYPTVLDASTVLNHYNLGTGTKPNQAPTASFTAAMTNLSGAFDATASSDPDGTVASYAWDFGDGQTGVGATPTHVYQNAGTYTVTLTVTDNAGATSTPATKQVAATKANQAPTAAFTSTVSNLTASLDGTTSSDPDGTVASYAWDFGDGKTGTGATTTHAYAAAGTYTVGLTVTDNQGLASAVTTHTVTVTAPANQPPVAAFTSSTTNLTVAVDGSGSSDPDGTIASYAWNWGDGQTSTGATASHAYAAAGTYTVTLTVTDNQGATAQKTATVTPTAPAGPQPLAADAFNRTLASGWGSADTGGAWTVSGGATSYSVAPGYGQQSATLGASRTSSLNTVSSTSTDSTVKFSTTTMPTGGGTYVSVIGRLVGASDYEARVWVKSTGQVQLQLLQGSTVLSAANIAGITYNAGDTLSVRVQVTGTNPTTIRASVWSASQTAPATWQLQTTDTTAALQVAGSVGLREYLSGTATTTPVVVRYTGYQVVPVA